MRDKFRLELIEAERRWKLAFSGVTLHWKGPNRRVTKCQQCGGHFMRKAHRQTIYCSRSCNARAGQERLRELRAGECASAS